MSSRARAITVVLLVLFALALAYVIWVQTKLLLISLGLLAATGLILYFMYKRR